MMKMKSRSNRVLRSAGALSAGVVTVVALSLGTDEIMRALGWFPPISQPLRDGSLLLMALAHRIAYGVLGGYVVARLAPSTPMTHSVVYGALGLVLSSLAAVAMWGVGPNWYPVAVAATALPCAGFGGLLHRRFHVER